MVFLPLTSQLTCRSAKGAAGSGSTTAPIKEETEEEARKREVREARMYDHITSQIGGDDIADILEGVICCYLWPRSLS